MRKRIYSILLSLVLVCTYILPYLSIQVYGAENNLFTTSTAVNIAKGKMAVASDHEADIFKAEKAFDGIINRDVTTGQSRWASATAAGEKWLQVDLGASQTFKHVVIEWERRNPTDYAVQTSDNGTTWTDVYTSTVAPTNFRQTISLDAPATGRYVRLLVKKYLPNSEGINWNTVSVFEMEIYEDMAPEAGLTLDEVVSSLVVPDIKTADGTMTMPVVPEGFGIELIGADYEQVIGKDGTIYQPLIDTEVSVNFVVTDGTKKKESQAILVTVPGKNPTSGTNAKPAVIPELREWFGENGNFQISDTTKIIIDPASESELMKMARIFAKDYKEIVGKTITIENGTNPGNSDFYFTLNTDDDGLGEEGYYVDIDSYVTVKASHKTGAFWSTRTILQILKQTGNTIPKGLIRDYPRFEIRGFMLDVGRKVSSLEYLYDYMKNMSWYKLNDFQIHLNDNYIFLEDYGQDAIDAYAGWRLESNIEGLESTDGSYSKKEFAELIDRSREYGVNIVPEIDTPAHALALTQVRPDLKVGSNGREADHLDITNPETLPFVKSIFDEYIDENVFRDATVHIGTDEFDAKFKEEFRKYTDDMIRYMRDEKGRTTRVWGSLSARNGNTPVTSENVQLNIWNTGWAEPQSMYNQGYDLINTVDGELYIVPGAGYYNDYLNAQHLYNNWTPEKFGNGVIIPAGSDQMLGAMYALWNDQIDKRANGIVQYDMFDRTFAAMPALAEKMWGKAEDKTYAQFKVLEDKVGLAPNTNPRYEVASKTGNVLSYDFEQAQILDQSGNDYHSVSSSNVSLVTGKKGKGLALKGGESFVETPINNLGPTNSFKVWVKKDISSGSEEQVLLESNEGVIKAVQKNTGKVGFSREGYDYSFDYTLPDNEWVELGIAGYQNKTELYINNTKIDEISRNSPEKHFATLILPLLRIGSTENAFKGVIDDLRVYNTMEIKDPTLISQSQMSISATSEHPNIGKEGLAKFAIDGDENTIWHTNYANKVDLPHSITINLNSQYEIDKFTYLPRSDNPGNGRITKYELSVSTDGTDFIKVSEGNWENSSALKVVELEPVEASYIRLTAKEGIGGFASAAELNVYQTLKGEERDSIVKLTVDQDIKSGEDFAITVSLDQVTEKVYSQDITLKYNPATITFKGVEAVEPNQKISDDEGIKIDENLGSIRVLGVALETPDGLTGNVDLFKFNFIANEIQTTVSSNISVDMEAGTMEGDISNVIKGSDSIQITVEGDSEEPVEPGIDKAKLAKAITEAETIVQEAVEGSAPGQYPEGAKATLNNAITSAKMVKNSATTQDEINAALIVLKKAISDFEESRIKDPANKPGDINGDGKVNIGDLALVAYHYLATEKDSGPSWLAGAGKCDVVKDGVIDMLDLVFIAKAILGLNK